MNDDEMCLYALFDTVGKQYQETLEVYPDDEKASVAFAKTVAFSNVVKEEFAMYRIGYMNLTTGELRSCPPSLIPCDEAVYSRAVAVLRKRDEVEEENKAKE